jgi:hypothetical protein
MQFELSISPLACGIHCHILRIAVARSAAGCACSERQEGPLSGPRPSENGARHANDRFGEAAPRRCHAVRRSAKGRHKPSSVPGTKVACCPNPTIASPRYLAPQMHRPNLHPMKMRKKSDLPTKVCPVCGRPFAWRKKWARDWAQVVYCSDRCRRSVK